MFKVKTNQGPALLNEIFRSQNYIGPTLRRSKDFLRPNVRTQKYEEKSLERKGNVKWNLLPNEIKDVETLKEFKSKWWSNGVSTILLNPLHSLTYCATHIRPYVMQEIRCERLTRCAALTHCVAVDFCSNPLRSLTHCATHIRPSVMQEIRCGANPLRGITHCAA